jgi:hypothetical protein
MVAVAARAKFPRRDEYARECAEPIRCSMVITKTIHAGEEVLTNYQWDLSAQRDRKCGYNHHREKDRRQVYTEEEIQDEEEWRGRVGKRR